MYFPQYRPRRMRYSEALRSMVRETRLDPADLVYPLFVIHGEDVQDPVSSMPGVFQLSINRLLEEAAAAVEDGIGSIVLFGIPAHKDEGASGASDAEGTAQMAIRALKDQLPGLAVIADVCVCQYVPHGHCGIVRDGMVDNDLTLEVLSKAAVSLAEAGADVVAPSDMMDGRVAAIRGALDQEGFIHVPIFSYSVKYASSFYRPFGEAADCPPQGMGRQTYQLDPANSDEAVREALMDIEEGADLLIVKPALPYLDVIQRLKQETRFPVAAYSASGEFAMFKAAALKGWIDEPRVVIEALTGMKRAGADLIMTYYAREAVAWIQAG